MDDNPQLFELYRLGFPRRKYPDIVRPGDGLGDLAGRIVIAGNNEDLDPSPGQAAHPPGEIKSGIVILPIAVIQVAGNKNKCYRLVDGQVDEGVKGPPRRPANLGNRRIGVRFKAAGGSSGGR
jgi:hypothetical protein